MGGLSGGQDDDEGDLARFAAALDRLARRWLWWFFVAHVGFTTEVSGQRIGIYPLAWILGPLVLIALLDFRAAASGPAARVLTVLLALATVTAAIDITASLLGYDNRSSAVGGVVWALVMVDLGLFSVAMARWTESGPARSVGASGTALGQAWRRSARWCWASLSTAAALVIVG